MLPLFFFMKTSNAISPHENLCISSRKPPFLMKTPFPLMKTSRSLHKNFLMLDLSVFKLGDSGEDSTSYP